MTTIYEPLQWARMKNTSEREDWVAHTLDGLRMYSINRDKTDDSPYWRLAWKEKNTSQVVREDYKFLNREEAKNAADLIESARPIDKEKINEIISTFQMTVAGNTWQYLGIQANCRIWVSVQEGNEKAYVAIYNFDNPKQGWVMTERIWLPPKLGTDIRTLDVKVLGKYKDLEKAQQSVALLPTHKSSKVSPENIEEIGAP